MKRYEIRWAVLDPVRGAEMAKTRPVVIAGLFLFSEHFRDGQGVVLHPAV